MAADPDSYAAWIEGHVGGPVHRAARSVRVTWRDRVRGRWHYLRPPVLLALGIAVLVLGTIGYEQALFVPVNGGPAENYGFFDALYRAISLFAFGGTVTPPVPAALQIARIAAPVLTGYAAVGTILALSREQARVLGIRLLVRRHVVVAGLGVSGSRVALALVEKEPVVVIESNPANERLATARLRGVRVLLGQATDEVPLRRAGLERARALVVSCGSDGTNVDVAAAAVKLSANRRDPLWVFVHLRDLDMWSSLAAESATFGLDGRGPRVEYFNVFATAAQLLLERHPPFSAEPGAETYPRRPHVLVVGLSDMGEQIVLQIARMWRSLPPALADHLRITITGPTADLDLARLLERYPALDRYCALDARPLAIESSAFQSGAAMLGENGTCDVSQAYVCLQDEGDALIAALALHARSDAAHVPVIVALADEEAGIGIVVASTEGRFAGIEPFGVLSSATSDELLLRGTNELIARAQHAQWLRNEQELFHRDQEQAKAQGRTIEPKPHMKPWDELDDTQREDNRRFADHIHTKFRFVDCMLVPMPLPHPDEPRFAFTHGEVEALALLEHERWMKAKLDDGWRYGEKRDNANMIHDQLKPWKDLDERNRDYDRNTIRELPATLELAGFRIERRRPMVGDGV